MLPRSLIEAMPLPWQQHMHYLLSEFHQAFSHVTWPIYRVQPSRREKLVDLDEEQLAEVGYLVEIDVDGELVYRDRSGRLVEQPADTTVLVSCLDPIPPPRQPNAAHDTNMPGRPPARPDQLPPAARGRTRGHPPSGFPAQSQAQQQPGQPFGPTGYQRPGRRRGQQW